MKNEIQTATRPDITALKHWDNKQYLVFNKRMLRATGLWPSQPPIQKVVKNIGLLIVSLIVMVAQVRAMIDAREQFNLFAACVTPMALNIGGSIKLVSSMFHDRKMQKDWENIRHLPETIIFEKCGEKGRRWTLLYFTFVYVMVSPWIVMAFSPKIMDALVPLNHSRRRFDLLPTDFMIDPEKYFYPILIFITLGLLYQLLVIVAIDTLYIVLAQHGCAMFEMLRSMDVCIILMSKWWWPMLCSCYILGVATAVNPTLNVQPRNRYNLHNVIQDVESTEVILKPNIHKDMHFHKITCCIKQHRVITEFIKDMESTCQWRLFFVIGLNMMSLSFTGYMVIVTGHDSEVIDTMRYVLFTVAQVLHLFCNTLPGHWIMDASSFIPISAYGCRWYMMSLRSRKLILFLLRASIDPCKITAGKLYVMSVENFSSVLRLSITYLTVLNSIP